MSRRYGPTPTAEVITAAEETNRRMGHENLGHLSWAQAFLPVTRPLLRMPEAHACWDEIAAHLPDHFRDLSLRRRLDAMPTLRAENADLPDAFLLRAAALLGLLAHAYYTVETFLPRELPASIAAPWRVVRRRLGRAEEVLTYIDNIIYNWRLVDPQREDPMRLDNLRLLVPTVDTPAESIFYLTQVEIAAQATPILSATVRAQQAVLSDDPDGLCAALGAVAATLRQLRDVSLPNIDPRPASSTFQDPVVWAKTVAPLSVPIRAGLHGPSGTNSPIFNTLDVFFERKQHDSILGREIKALRGFYPAHWQAFLAAVSAVSIRSFVRRTGRPQLRAAWEEALGDYAGKAGLLARHRLKAYGYMEVAFRVGRSVTIGGFAGASGEKVWRQIDRELEAARRERLADEAPAIERPAVEPAPAVEPPPAVEPAVVRPPAHRADHGVDPGTERTISIGELARRNDETAGFWIAVGGGVSTT